MAMIQNTNEVHFTGMTRVELEGNKIIATQNGESQVTIAANTRSLAELAGKINESAAKKETVTDQEMLDRDVVERYSGYSGQYRIALIGFIVLYYILLLFLSNAKFFSVLIVEVLVFFAILGDDFVNLFVLLLTPTIVVRVLAHHIRPIVSF